MDRNVTRQVAVIVATVALIVVNILANALPFNGLTTGEISGRFDVYFVPAAYAFSIWLVIYVLLIGYTVYQALPDQRNNTYLWRIGYLYVLSCIANIAWLFLWHYLQFALTLVAMFVLLLSLIAIYLRLEIGRRPATTAEQWFVRIPFSIYLGWITVATIANVTIYLASVNWSGWGLAPEVWAVIMLIVGGVIASAVSITRGDVAYVLVIVWAFVGITVSQWDTPLVAITALVVALLVAATLAVGIPRARQRLNTWAA